MNQVVKYKILKNDSASRLSEKVQEEINEGWQPLGGVSVIETGDKNIQYDLHQAMVKYSVENNNNFYEEIVDLKLGIEDLRIAINNLKNSYDQMR